MTADVKRALFQSSVTLLPTTPTSRQSLCDTSADYFHIASISPMSEQLHYLCKSDRWSDAEFLITSFPRQYVIDALFVRRTASALHYVAHKGPLELFLSMTALAEHDGQHRKLLATRAETRCTGPLTTSPSHRSQSLNSRKHSLLRIGGGSIRWPTPSNSTSAPPSLPCSPTPRLLTREPSATPLTRSASSTTYQVRRRAVNYAKTGG